MVACRTLRNFICRGYHLLVVTVEEVHLKSLYPHLGILFHYGVCLCHVPVGIAADEVAPTRPKNYAYTPTFAIFYQLFYVDVGIKVFCQRLV